MRIKLHRYINGCESVCAERFIFINPGNEVLEDEYYMEGLRELMTSPTTK